MTRSNPDRKDPVANATNQQASGLSRRTFLTTSAAAFGAAGLARVGVASPILRAAGMNRDPIISIYLRGGMDGLSAVVPYGDSDYAAQRQQLAVPGPGVGTGRALDLDGFFGLNPTGAPLMLPYNDGRLLFVHASGIAAPNRSHFDAQRRMETATPDSSPAPSSTGWLGRHLLATSPAGTGIVRGIASNNLLPATLVGGPGTLPVRDIGRYTFPGRQATRASRRAVLETTYSAGPQILRTGSATTFGAIDLLQTVDYANYVSAPAAVYPATRFGGALRQVAAMIKAGTQLETAQINLGGWDHHSALAPLDGRFALLFDELANGLQAFYLDMQNSGFGYVVLAQTEFGRRIAPNGSDGTDHGFGSCMLAMGPSVLGGRVLANWPGVSQAASVNGDLAVTTDWRDIAAEILVRRAGGTDLNAVFPGYTPTFQGVVQV